MRLDRFTTLAQEAIASAQSAANTAGHGEVSPLHLLAAMLQERQSVAASILSKAGVDPARVLQVAETELRRLPTVQGSSPQGGQNLMGVLAAAEKEATKLKDGYISSEHLLLALSDVPGPGREVLSAVGADSKRLLAAIEQIRKASGVSNVNDPGAEGSFEALKKYAVDLNERAAAGKIYPVIGRDEEIRRCMQVLSRRTKNNPVLIGEPGVGKTAIAEGLAIRIVNGDCPESMRESRITGLDVGQLLAGAKYRGEFEERLKKLMDEIKQNDDIILM